MLQDTSHTAPAKLGSLRPGAPRGSGRSERKTGVRSNDRIRSQVDVGGAQLGREVERRTGNVSPRVQSALRAQATQGEEPDPSSAHSGEYEALLRVARDVDWRFRVALVLAQETGHRIGAIRQLWWSNIDLEGRTIRWRGEYEKTGYEHQTPANPEALSILEEVPRKNPGSGDAPLLPTREDPSKCVSRSLARDWWRKGQELAALEPARGRGWHSLEPRPPERRSEHRDRTPLSTDTRILPSIGSTPGPASWPSTPPTTHSGWASIT